MAQIFIDAATRQNPFESSIGYVIRTDEAVLEFGQYLGEMENHEAEWNALIAALKQAAALGIRSVILKSDSRIVVDSVHKNYTKNPKFKPYLLDYQGLQDKFDLLIIDWIPRDQNKHADHVARHYLNQH
ncbi:ribonuclease HI family protein [Macrococcus brunensis]|uniref:Ribonuclease HI family protein n=1 Tax=Macrococcus brunensis TaxID=198483 RepID=A0A4R6BCH2_9STAP|nr:ribonuclease HI family protein [Macrococcus brunensis]TDL95565.1 ribonuclease HI family protein [Macrococcus brunensis]